MISKRRIQSPDDEAFDDFLESVRETVEIRVFLCGKGIDRAQLPELAANKGDKRAYLWSRLEKEVPGCKVLLGEHDFLINSFGKIFQKAYKDPKTVNLASFEAALARHVHLIVLFPESAGSFAELGLFTAPGGVAKKLFVVVEKQYERQDTFLNSFLYRGPISSVTGERGHLRYISYDDFDALYEAVKELVEHIAERITTEKIFIKNDL